MGRLELVQKIVDQYPHLGQRDAETIVNTVIREMSLQPLSVEHEISTEVELEDAHRDDSDVPTDLEGVLARMEALTADRPELADRSLDFMPPELVRAAFELAFDALAKSAAAMAQTVQKSGRFHEEFARRSAEIAVIRADIDARLEKLTAAEQRA